jgi:hypothetical protein
MGVIVLARDTMSSILVENPVKYPSLGSMLRFKSYAGALVERGAGESGTR